MEEVGTTKWRGEIRETINVPIEEAWKIFGNFCDYKNIVPQCKEELIEGERNAVNCVKRITTTALDGSDRIETSTERVVERDDGNYILGCVMLENTFNFVNFARRLHLVPGVHRSTVVQWSVELDSMPGESEASVISLLTDSLRTTIKTAESYYAQHKYSPAALT